MKKLLLAAAVLLFLPRAHASCTVTLSPSSSTLQTTQQEGITATLTGSGCGTTTNWSLSCSPSGSCGSLSGESRIGATYKAPTTPPSGTVTATVKAANNGNICSGSGCAVVTIKVPMNLTVTPTNGSIYLENSETMSATENYSDGSSNPLSSGVTYSSSNTSVATVSSSTVTGTNFSAIPGSPTITGSYTDPYTSGLVTGTTLVSVLPAVEVNSLFPPTTGSDVTAVKTYIIGNSYVYGINLNEAWSGIESSNGAGTGSGGYDFSTFDATLGALFNTTGSLTNAPTKKINLVVLGVNDVSPQNPANKSTPVYVFTPTWNTYSASHTPSWLTWTAPAPTGTSSNGQAGGLDVVTCTSYEGNGNQDSGFPVVYEKPYVEAYGNFIEAVIKHYSNQCSSSTPFATPPCSATANNPSPYYGPALASYIGYIRIGLSSGGEVFPHCSSLLPGFSETAWVSTYIGGMEGAERSFQTADSSTIQLNAALDWAPGSTDGTYPDAEAVLAYNSGLQSQGMGSQGLQASDVYNYSVHTTCSSSYPQNCPCQADWCTNFNTYYLDAPYDQHPIAAPLELQTYMYSDPNCEGQISASGCSDSGESNPASVITGSLYDVVPFAVNRHATDLELYTYDILYGFDSGYCSLSGKDPNNCPLSTVYPGHYQTVIQDAATGATEP